MTNIQLIIASIDKYLERSRLNSIGPVEANAMLEKQGILLDSPTRPGRPLRKLLRENKIPYAFQSGGKGSEWIIPHSSERINTISNYQSKTFSNRLKTEEVPKKQNKTIDIMRLKDQIEKARETYKPTRIRILFIAEAPPDSIDRFFYYPTVRKADFLFLGIIEALYPGLKENFLKSGRATEVKKVILEKFMHDGFYLIDLSELPLSLINSDLSDQVPELLNKINLLINTKTQIIIIKANVFNLIFNHIKLSGFQNIIEIKIPFPGQGHQREFQTIFRKALNIANQQLQD
jgi:hypothetical protein